MNNVRSSKLKVFGIAIATFALAFSLIGCSSNSDQKEGDANSAPEGQQFQSLSWYTLEADAPEWNAQTSTPVFACFAYVGSNGASANGADDSQKGIQTYPIDANFEQSIEILPGTWSLTFISPLNADGSYYKCPNGDTITVTEEGSDVPVIFNFELVPADQADPDEILSIVGGIQGACTDNEHVMDVKQLFEQVRKCATSNPNVKSEEIDHILNLS